MASIFKRGTTWYVKYYVKGKQVYESLHTRSERAAKLAKKQIEVQKVIDTEQYDGKTIRAQAICWSGLSQERLNSTEEAYELYRRVTFDFPDSIWAKYGRGRLADPAFEKIIAKEEQAREILLESLKKQK